MTDFIIKKLKYDLSSNAGLTLVGQFLKRTESNKRVDHAFPLAGKGIINGDISKSHLGLLVQGKNDFDAIEALEAMSSVFCSPLDDEPELEVGVEVRCVAHSMTCVMCQTSQVACQNRRDLEKSREFSGKHLEI